jgi:biopolymer transport protein ExbD
VDIRQVRGVIERLHIERPEDTVVIVADKESQAGVVAAVMDEVRLGGIKDIALAAAPRGG